MSPTTTGRGLDSSRIWPGPRAAVAAVVVWLLLAVLAVPVGADDGSHGGAGVGGGGSGGDAAALAGLAGAQEALLNAYRCLFGVDVVVVPGGCASGVPAAGPSDPGAGGVLDAGALGRLVTDQEALLNAYRCRFGVDVEVVPGGCVDGRPAAGPAAGDEPEGSDAAGGKEVVGCSGPQHCLVSLSGRGGKRWCGLRSDQAVVCIARDLSGTLESGSYRPFVGGYSSVSAGLFFACGVRADRRVECWDYQWQPTTVAPPGDRFLSVSAGIAFTEFACGIREDRAAVCWGDDVLGTESERIAAPGGRFLSVSAGWQHACGIREDRTVECWGDNKHGRLDAPAGRFTSVSAGFWFSCGIREDRTATCWGNNLRRGYNAPEGRFLSVSAGQGLACGLREDHTAACWGPPTAGGFGELDPPPGRFVSVSGGAGTACGLRPHGILECWGQDTTSWPVSGRLEVPVYYCARQGKYTLADLEYETQRMNQVVAPFYARESSGLVEIEFIAAGIESPDIDWDNTAISDAPHEFGVRCNPEPPPEFPQPHHKYKNVLLLIDTSPGERTYEVECPGACAGSWDALMPTVEALYSSPYICPSASPPRLVRELPGTTTASPYKDTAFGNIRAGRSTSCRDLAYWVYDRLVAHELGHALFGFDHPSDCSIMSGNPWACPPTRAQNMDDTLRTPNLLQTAYIGCADRQKAGWPQDPQRCPQHP